MIMDAFDSLPPTAASWLRASALAPSVPAYWRYLTERRYALSTARAYIRCLAHFARWIRRRRHLLDDLDDAISRFVDGHLPRCNCPSPMHRCRHQVRAALRHLRVVFDDSSIATDRHRIDPIEEALHRYDEHMQQAKGLAQSTRLRRLKIVDALLHTAAMVTPTADQLRRFIGNELDRVSPASGGAIVSALRSYLRFRAFEGDCVEHLLPVIGSPARWRLAPLPQTLSRAEVEQLLGAFPPECPRAFAPMPSCDASWTSGLRSREVISLDARRHRLGSAARCASASASRAAWT